MKADNGYFPNERRDYHGITVRDEIAIRAMDSVTAILIACFQKDDQAFSSTDMVTDCYEVADAFIEQSNK